MAAVTRTCMGPARATHATQAQYCRGRLRTTHDPGRHRVSDDVFPHARRQDRVHRRTVL